MKRASAMALAILTALCGSAAAMDCSADAERVNARCYPGRLQAAVDAAIASDRPLYLPRGTYKIAAPLVIDYTPHARTGFMLVSDGATIDGTALASGPALRIMCTATDCFYFHQQGTLFVNANTAGYAVEIGAPGLADAHNSIKIDHLIVNNGNPSPQASGVQLNYVLNADLFIVADSAGGGSGIGIEQLQFSVLRGAASATNGTAMTFGPGYNFANTFQALDLEVSRVCVSHMHPRTQDNTWTSPYLNCPTGLVYGSNSPRLGEMFWHLGGDVGVPYVMR
jgi:hypothetical protein